MKWYMCLRSFLEVGFGLGIGTMSAITIEQAQKNIHGRSRSNSKSYEAAMKLCRGGSIGLQFCHCP